MILGVDVNDVTMDEAIGSLAAMLGDHGGCSHAIYYVNAHTLNLACDDDGYRRVLNRANYVFGDGTGVRWATRILRSASPKDNVNGTDLTPKLFTATAGRGYRYYLLGTTPERIERAARYARRTFTGWIQAGFHHGYVTPQDDTTLAARINASRPHLLLVGMGNPLQERWIDRNLGRLNVPVCMAIGGLFDYWSGELERAPLWVRRLGQEWLYLLLCQPHKFRRYIVGNPKFLARVLSERVRAGRRRQLGQGAS